MGELVTFEDWRQRRPEPFASHEEDRARALLSDASDIVREATGLPAEEWPTRTPATVRQIVMRLASRAFDNPLGLSSESVGDLSYRMGRQQTNGLFLLQEEREALAEALGLSPLVCAEISIGYEDLKFRQFAPLGRTAEDGVTWVGG
ncbi:hypothetical protein [Streptomyces bacillaris]|uniref:hypothetical protein n=1 Tax=Streptomyces bacillaris TaxID=68179 RepID=UPI00380266B0